MNTYTFLDLYVYIFLVLVFIYILFGVKSCRRQSNLCFSVLLLFTIFRYNVGWDYETYVDTVMYDEILLDDPRYALFSRLILYVANKVHFYPIVFIVFGTLHLAIFRFIINRMSINPAFSWAIYLLLPAFFSQDLGTIRQAVGLEFIFLAFMFLSEKNYKMSALSYITAILFHASTVYGIFLLPLMFYNLPNWVNWGMFIASFVLSNLLMSVLQGLSEDSYNIARAVAYLDADLRKTSLLNYLYYAINVFFLLLYNRFRGLDGRAAKYIQIANFGVFTFNLFLFEPTMSTRLCTLYIIVWVLLVPYVPYLFSSNVKSVVFVTGTNRRVENGKKEFLVLLPFIALYFFYLMVYVNAYNNKVLYKVSFIPYDFWWNHL